MGPIHMGKQGVSPCEKKGMLAPCGTGVLAPKEEMLQSLKLGSSIIRVLEARGLAGLAGLARLARLAGLAGRRIGTTKSNTLDALERLADSLSIAT